MSRVLASSCAVRLVATTHIVNQPDPKTMSKNKKKKMKKKEKMKQKMLELTQQQIQVDLVPSVDEHGG